MARVSKVLAPLALIAGIAGATAFVTTEAGAQPPFGKRQPGKGGDDRKKTDDKKVEEKKIEKKVEGRKGEEKKGPAPKPDAVVDAWVKVLIEKITDPHDTVRDSARGALVGVGPPAIPALQALTDGNDPAKAVAARKLINTIQGNRGGQAAGQPEQRRPGFGGPGGMGFGPGGFGRPGMPGKGPMGFPGMRPGGPGKGPDRDRGRGPDRGGRDKKDAVEVAPMPRVATR